MKTSSEIYLDLEPIVKNYLPEDVNTNEITMSSDLTRDLNINSVYLVDIILDVEDAFDIQLENKEIEQLRTVQDVIEIIQSKL